jgi:hypothetical protein
MGFLKTLFSKNKIKGADLGDRPITSGEMIAEMTGGASLVDGKQTWEHAQINKHDLEIMKKCCTAELEQMELTGLAPAPFYFERVAIMSRKAGNYQQEVDYCERYIAAIQQIYDEQGTPDSGGMKQSPRYQAIVKRLPKAKELLAKQKAKPD